MSEEDRSKADNTDNSQACDIANDPSCTPHETRMLTVIIGIQDSIVECNKDIRDIKEQVDGKGYVAGPTHKAHHDYLKEEIKVKKARRRLYEKVRTDFLSKIILMVSWGAAAFICKLLWEAFQAYTKTGG